MGKAKKAIYKGEEYRVVTQGKYFSTLKPRVGKEITVKNSELKSIKSV